MTRFAALLSGLLLLGFCGAFCVRAADGPPHSQTLALPEYLAALHSAADALGSRDPAQMRAFRADLPEEWQVASGQQTFSVKTAWLASALAAAESDPSAPATADRVRQAQQHLAALEEAGGALAAENGPAAAAPDSRARVERILRAPEFHGAHEQSWLEKWTQRARDWVSRHFDKLFARVGIPASVGNGIAWVLIVLAGALLTWWTIRALTNAGSLSRMDLHGAVPAGQDWRFWAREARAAAERGDYRAAIHAAYWTGVARLEEYRLLPEDRSRTPRESLRLVEQGSPAYPPLRNLTRRFELTWYGYRAATADDWRDAMQQLEAIECLRSSTPAIAGS